MRERIDMCPSLFTVSPSKLLFYICMFSTLYKAKQKYVCFQSHAKKYFGLVGLKWFVFNFSFLVHLGRRLKCTIVIMGCPSSVRPSSLTFHIFDFSSETAEQNSTKLDRKQDLNVLYQVCVFRADRKNKMATLASDWPRHFRLLLWNRWTEFNETWQEARSQHPLPSLCFSGRSQKQDHRPGQSAKNVAHCTQVHDMWPFGPLV